MSNFEDVKTFMKTFGQTIRTKPQFPDEKTIQLRFDLIQEELNELKEAIVFILTRYSIFFVFTFVKCSGILLPALLTKISILGCLLIMVLRSL